MRTTLNLKIDDIRELDTVAARLGMSRTSVLKAIIAMIIKDRPLIDHFDGAIRYQEDSSDFEKVHISFSQVEYEQNLDLKKLFKFSLSFLVAFGISFYADKLLERYLKLSHSNNSPVVDNYTKSDYYYVTSYTFSGYVIFLKCERKLE